MSAIAFVRIHWKKNNNINFRELYLMPYSNDVIREQNIKIKNIKTASVDSEMTKIITKCLANNKTNFTFNEIDYRISYYKIYNWDYIETFKEGVFYDNRYFQQNINKNIDLTTDNKYIIFAVKGTVKCSYLNHTVEPCYAKVKDLYNDRIFIIKVYHCIQCNRYFIPYAALDSYHKQHFFPAIKNFYDIEFNGALRNNSILKLHGYDTSLSEQRRRLLLKNLITKGIVNEFHIIQHLQFCIDVPGQRYNNDVCCNIWESDLHYILNLPIQERTIINGKIKRT